MRKEIYMYPNPFSGRNYISGEYASNEDGTNEPDLTLTLATVILCIAGPFWLIYRLLEFVVKKSALFTSQAWQKMKEFSRA